MMACLYINETVLVAINAKEPRRKDATATRNGVSGSFAKEKPFVTKINKPQGIMRIPMAV